jgi:hypothetical protein
MLQHMRVHEKFEPNYLWDPDKNACQKAIEVDTKARIVGTPGEAIDAADLVYLACPPKVREVYAVETARKGKALFLEKPLGIDIEHSSSLIDKLKGFNVPLAVNFVFDVGPAKDILTSTVFAMRNMATLRGETLSFNDAIKQATGQMYLFNIVNNNTAMAIKDMATAIPKLVPITVQFGLTVTEAAGALAAMKASGVSAAEGTVALRTGLLRLTSLTKQADEKVEGARQRLKDFNFEAGVGIETLANFGQSLLSIRRELPDTKNILNNIECCGITQFPSNRQQTLTKVGQSLNAYTSLNLEILQPLPSAFNLLISLLRKTCQTQQTSTQSNSTLSSRNTRRLHCGKCASSLSNRQTELNRNRNQLRNSSSHILNSHSSIVINNIEQIHLPSSLLNSVIKRKSFPSQSSHVPHSEHGRS